MRSDVSCTIEFFDDSWPKMNNKIVIVNLKRHDLLGFILLKFLSKLLLFFILSKLNLPKIFVLQLFLI